MAQFKTDLTTLLCLILGLN